MRDTELDRIYYVYMEDIKSNTDYFKYAEKYNELFNKLYNDASEENKNILKELDDADCCMEMEANYTYFKAGFKAGLRLGMECNE